MTPPRITIVEVGPRDGLQNERALVPTADKIELINRLSAAHLPVIEVSAFVSPRWVPQMADAADVFAGITRAPGIRYTALGPNLAGLDRAVAAGVTEIAVFSASTETFSRKNINQRIDESLATYAHVCGRAPGAAGNLATDDLIYMLDGLGLETGVSLAGVTDASTFIASKIDHRLPSRYAQAQEARRSLKSEV